MVVELNKWLKWPIVHWLKDITQNKTKQNKTKMAETVKPVVTTELVKLLGLSFGLALGMIKTLEYMRYANDGYNNERKRQIENIVDDKIYEMEDKITEHVIRRLNRSKVTFNQEE
jgi:hypothetical protein